MWLSVLRSAAATRILVLLFVICTRRAWYCCVRFQLLQFALVRIYLIYYSTVPADTSHVPWATHRRRCCRSCVFTFDAYISIIIEWFTPMRNNSLMGTGLLIVWFIFTLCTNLHNSYVSRAQSNYVLLSWIADRRPPEKVNTDAPHWKRVTNNFEIFLCSEHHFVNMLPSIRQAARRFCLEQNKDLMKFILEIRNMIKHLTAVTQFWRDTQVNRNTDLMTNKLTIAKLETSPSHLFGLNYELVRRVESIVPSQPYNI